MPCYSPLRAFKTSGGEFVFSELKRYGDIIKGFDLPCGQCIGCRLERSRQWAMRCMHEASMHGENCFITLTYDDEHLPDNRSLLYNDFSLFMKRLRKYAGADKLRFYMCGEYGPQDWRPHYHACIFGFSFDDLTYLKLSGGGDKLYTSDALSRLWKNGLCSVGLVTFESAAYVARYCMSKVTGEAAIEYYKRETAMGVVQLEPEFNGMSLKPGIGADWYAKYKSDVYTYDYVVVNGQECRPPKYYDKLFKSDDPDMLDEIKAQRELAGYLVRSDNTPERLAVKKQVTEAKMKLLHRGD